MRPLKCKFQGKTVPNRHSNIQGFSIVLNSTRDTALLDAGHKVHLPRVPTVSVPSSELGPRPLSQASVPPPGTKGERHTRMHAGEVSQFGRLEEKPSTLSTL